MITKESRYRSAIRELAEAMTKADGKLDAIMESAPSAQGTRTQTTCMAIRHLLRQPLRDIFDLYENNIPRESL